MSRRKPQAEPAISWGPAMDADLTRYYDLVSIDCLASHLTRTHLAESCLLVTSMDVVNRAAELGLSGGGV